MFLSVFVKDCPPLTTIQLIQLSVSCINPDFNTASMPPNLQQSSFSSFLIYFFCLLFSMKKNSLLVFKVRNKKLILPDLPLKRVMLLHKVTHTPVPYLFKSILQ